MQNKHENQYFNDHPVIDTYIINEVIEDNYNIIDLGANVGYETALYLNKTKGQIYAFEPFKTVYKQLKYLQKQAHNLTIYNVAIADENKEAILLSDTHNQGNTINNDYLNHFSHIFNKNNQQKVKIRTLDYYNLKNIDFLKIDVEGAEHLIFKGATSFFKNNNPIVQVEMYPFMEKNIIEASSQLLKHIKRVVVDKDYKLKLLDYKNDYINYDNYNLIEPPTYLLFNDNNLDKLKKFFI